MYVGLFSKSQLYLKLLLLVFFRIFHWLILTNSISIALTCGIFCLNWTGKYLNTCGIFCWKMIELRYRISIYIEEMPAAGSSNLLIIFFGYRYVHQGYVLNYYIQWLHVRDGISERSANFFSDPQPWKPLYKSMKTSKI